MLSGYARPVAHLDATSPAETLRIMAKLIQQGQFDYRIRGLAEEIIGRLFPHDYLSEYAAILNWVRKNVRYTRDPRTIEQIQMPAITVETKQGDCDDSSVLVGALVGAVGAQVRLVAGAFASSPKHPRNGQPLLSHVWLEAYEPAAGAWVVLDPVPGRKVNQMLGRLTRTTAMEVLS